MIWFIASLFAVAFTGLSMLLLRAIQDGAGRYSDTYAHQTSRQFEDVFLFIPPQRINELGWAAAVLVFLLVFFATARFDDAQGVLTGLVLACATGGGALTLPSLTLRHLKRRRLQRFNGQLADTLIGMSNALKAGFSISQAFESVVREGELPIAQEFDLLLQQTRVGVSFSLALQNLEERVNSEDLRLVVVAIEAARKTGGNLTEVFEQIAGTIRERVRVERRIQTLTAMGRLQGIVLSLMPLVIGFALMMLDPEMMMGFLRSTAGAVIIAGVVVLITLGALVIRRIVRIDV